MNKQPTKALPEKEKMLALSNTEVERIGFHHCYGDDDDRDYDHDSIDDDRVSLSSASLKRRIKATRHNNCGGGAGAADPRDCSSSVSGPTDDGEYYTWYENSSQNNNNDNLNDNNAAATTAANTNTSSTASQSQNQNQQQRKRENIRRRSSQMSDITFDSISETILSESDLDDSSHIDEALALLVTRRFGIGSANPANNNNINNNNTTIEEEGQQQQHQQQHHQQHQQQQHQQQQHQQYGTQFRYGSYDSKRSGSTTAAVASSTTAPPTIPIRRGSQDPTIITSSSSTTSPPTIPRRRDSKDPTTIYTHTTTTQPLTSAAESVKKKVNNNKKEINSYLARRTTIARKTAATMAASSSKGNVESPKVPQRTRSNSTKSNSNASLPGASFSSTSSTSINKKPIATAAPSAAAAPIAAAAALGIVSSRFGSNEFLGISMEQSLLMYDRSPSSRGGAAYTSTIPTTSTRTCSRSHADGACTFVCASPPIRPQRRVSDFFVEEEDSDFEEDLLDALAEEDEEEREEYLKLLPAAKLATTKTNGGSSSNYKPTLSRIASFDNIQELSAEISSSLSTLSLSLPVQHTNKNQPPIIPIRRGSDYRANKNGNSTKSQSIIDDSLRSSCPTLLSSSLFDDELEFHLNNNSI